MSKVVNNTTYHDLTDNSLIALLESLRASKKRVLIVYGTSNDNAKTWQTWQERGTIGRSTGQSKIPLLVKTSRSLGGAALHDSLIVQVRESVGGKVLWTHQNYQPNK